MNPQQMQYWMSRLLLTGTLLALTVVTLGGIWYLTLHGSSPLQTELFNVHASDLKITAPLGFIELGLYLLIATQVLRLIWLLWFYIKDHDYWFSIFTAFILCLIIYSLFFLR